MGKILTASDSISETENRHPTTSSIRSNTYKFVEVVQRSSMEIQATKKSESRFRGYFSLFLMVFRWNARKLWYERNYSYEVTILHRGSVIHGDRVVRQGNPTEPLGWWLDHKCSYGSARSIWADGWVSRLGFNFHNRPNPVTNGANGGEWILLLVPQLLVLMVQYLARLGSRVSQGGNRSVCMITRCANIRCELFLAGTCAALTGGGILVKSR